MADTATTSLRLKKMEAGAYTDGWKDEVDKILDMIDGFVAGVVEIPVTSSPYTLSVSDYVLGTYHNNTFRVTSTLTSTIRFVCPLIKRTYTVVNATGATITFGPSAGLTVSISPGTTAIVFVNATGANSVLAANSSPSTGTGGVTSITAGTGLTGGTITTTGTIAADLASQSEAEAAASNAKLMTPQRTGQQINKRLASLSDAQAGTNTSNLMTPLRTQQQIDNWFTGKLKKNTFSLGVPENGDTASTSHGLGGVPTKLECRLRCASAENGWSVNDEIMTEAISGLGGDRALIPYCNASTIGVLCTDIALRIPHRSTGVIQTLTKANWRAVFYVERLV